MRKLYTILLLSGILMFSSCYTTQTAGRSGKIPPGQAKKYHGKKKYKSKKKGNSARYYAPGQRKKH
ncbi:quinol oxidase subunit 4 [Pedobacter sp.]|uniref:quinol oxidase subunit 4 n=1 Tax=Pedobacter sp. TaxID=1411316 RepID=UPI003D7F9352